MSEPYDPNPNNEIVTLELPVTRTQWRQWEAIAKRKGVTIEQYICSCVAAFHLRDTEDP